MDGDRDAGSYWRGYPDDLAPSSTADARPAGSEARSDSDGGSERVQPSGYQVYRAGYANSKSHVKAGLFAIFLGMFGIHKFYLGYFSTGFVTLAVTILGSVFTFGLAALVMWAVGIVEGVIYLIGGQQNFERTYVLGERQWF